MLHSVFSSDLKMLLFFPFQAAVSRVKAVAAALQEVKTKREHDDEHQCDVAFSSQAESISQACGDLSQQVTMLL